MRLFWPTLLAILVLSDAATTPGHESTTAAPKVTTKEASTAHPAQPSTTHGAPKTTAAPSQAPKTTPGTTTKDQPSTTKLNPATTQPPYNVKCSWNNCANYSTDPNVWNIHFIPHTHDDLGWLVTVDEYYTQQVRYIFNTFTQELLENPERRFSYAETGYLKRWLEENLDGIDILKKLIQTGQLEIIGGGWVQPDEAASHYYELLDVYTLGLGIMTNTFGVCAQPKAGWQIDPFGHSREHSNLLRLMGYESLWFAREHHLEHDFRVKNQALQMQWHTTDDKSSANTLLTGVFLHHYSAPGSFCFDIRCGDEPIQDNPNFENYNMPQRMQTFMDRMSEMRNASKTNHLMVLFGDDFNYQDAHMYYTNMDKVMKYLNQNHSNQFKAFYSTPSCYAQAIKDTGVTFPDKYTDFFPYGSDSHAYWTGYFTSKPGMKGQVRKSSGLLQLARQLQSLALTSWNANIGGQIETLERAVGLSQHHDAVTGTSKEFVTQDYIYRMTKGWTTAESVLNNAMQTITQGVKNNGKTLPQQTICRTINETECVFTQNNNEYTVTVHNGNGQTLETLVRIPLYKAVSSLTVTDSFGNSVGYQIINTFNNPGQLNNSNIAPYEIYFMASVQPLGFRTYYVSVTPSTFAEEDKKVSKRSLDSEDDELQNLNQFISNGLIQLNFNSQGYLFSYQDLTTGQTYPLQQQFKYYHGHDNNGRASGAYVFRPQEEYPFNFTDPIVLNVVNGPLAIEARQIVSPWISQVIRLIPGKKYVEFEWTVGPIPKDDKVGKEVISTYTLSGLKTNGTFYTDANGRQLVKRTRNWAESYTFENTEPVAANYYPIDSRILITDDTTSLAVLTDRAEGGGSLNDGQVEIMLHRRDFYDDGFGVGEALNQPGRDGRGLVVRGKHWMVLGGVQEVNRAHRTLAYEMLHAGVPVLTFGKPTSSWGDYRTDFVTDFTGINGPLDSGINLLTLKQIDANNILLRLEHVFQPNEDNQLSQPLVVDLTQIVSSYKISNVAELTLAGNQVVDSSLAYKVINLNPMDIKTYRLTVTQGSYSNRTSPVPPTTSSQPATQAQPTGNQPGTTQAPSSGKCSWQNCPIWSSDPNVWNVHIIPHTHDDLGWLKTVDGYYTTEVRYIFNTLTQVLPKNPSRRFSYCETGYMKRWLEENPEGADILRSLIQNGQLEIIGGGWVQPDEAASHYVELIDQYTLGLRILNDTFGECAHPKAAWQIDPFGHSREHARLVKQMGMESLWFARIHYLERALRKTNKSLQMMWHTDDDDSSLDNALLTGAFFKHYSAPDYFSFDIQNQDEPIQNDPKLENYNVQNRTQEFYNWLVMLEPSQQTNHFQILMGDDFDYQDAYMYFSNMDKLIDLLNKANFTHKINAQYSTPACYAQAVLSSNVTWPEKKTDFFPLADGDRTYWTGYFTSRPELKGLVRKSSELLQLARQLQSISQTWSNDIGKQIEALERAVGLSQHHDAVAGTALEFVSEDYIFRMLKGWTAVEQVLNIAMNSISQSIKNNGAQLPIQTICQNLNESECSITKSNNQISVTVHNAYAQNLEYLVRIPLYQNTDQVSVLDSNGNQVQYQIVNTFVNPSQINNTNISPYQISFVANVRPLGFRTYFVTINPSSGHQKDENLVETFEDAVMPQMNSISNGLIELDFDQQGFLSMFKDLTTGKTYALRQEFKYYHGYWCSSGKNCYEGSSQEDNAYIFRPSENDPLNFSANVHLNVINGSIVNEARQIISPWVSQTIRLIPNRKHVEFEWTIGPIPTDDQVGKDIISTYTASGIKNNGSFLTDANGRQLMKRQRNWSESYTYLNTEPVAANYYPIDSRIIISDGATSLAVLTDRSHGGGSINDGEIEIMLHRRTYNNDEISLNEPGRDGRGVVVRGKHWLVLGNAQEVTRVQRTLAFELFHDPVLTFASTSSVDSYRQNFVTDFSGLELNLPPNVNLLTLKQLDSSNVLIRLEHIYQKNEDPQYSQSVRVDLTNVIQGYQILGIQELGLAANKVINPTAPSTVTLNPMDIKTFQLTVQPGTNGPSPNPSTGAPPTGNPQTTKIQTLASGQTNPPLTTTQHQTPGGGSTGNPGSGSPTGTATTFASKANTPGPQPTSHGPKKVASFMLTLGLIVLSFTL